MMGVSLVLLFFFALGIEEDCSDFAHLTSGIGVEYGRYLKSDVSRYTVYWKSRSSHTSFCYPNLSLCHWKRVKGFQRFAESDLSRNEIETGVLKGGLSLLPKRGFSCFLLIFPDSCPRKNVAADEPCAK